MVCPRRPPRRLAFRTFFMSSALTSALLYKLLKFIARSMQYMDGFNQLILLLLIS